MGPSARSPHLVSGKPRVLLVDEIRAAAALERLLRDVFDLRTAHCTEEAHPRLAEGLDALVCSDAPPDIDAVALCWRACRFTPAPVCIVVSAWPSSSLHVAVAAGVVHRLLLRPVWSKDILAAVDVAIDLSRPATG